jgi:hypothetical protein
MKESLAKLPQRKRGGILNEKYPGALNNPKKRLEGHTIISKGRSKHFMVGDFEKSLLNIDKIKL